MHTGIPISIDRNANAQRCRVVPDNCTARLLRFEEVRANELARGTFCTVMAIEATKQFRLSCKANGFIFWHIDTRYNITRDDSSPGEPSEDEEANSADVATTTAVSFSSEQGSAANEEEGHLVAALSDDSEGEA